MFCCPCFQRPSQPKPSNKLNPIADSWKMDGVFEVNENALIGQGTFAEVYRVPLATSLKDKLNISDENAVLKKISILEHFFGIQVLEEMNRQQDNVKRSFLLEIAILSHFSNTRGFPQFFGYQYEPSLFMILKIYPHGNIYDLISSSFQHPLFPNGNRFQDALRLILDVAFAIRSLHNFELSHNDIKASNVLLTHDLVGVGAVLMDFGMAKPVTRTSEFQISTFTSISPHYASPDAIESYETAQVVERVEYGIKPQQNDIYAFGVLMFELITGKLAWPGIAAKDIPKLVQAGQRPLDVYLEKEPNGLKSLSSGQRSVIKLSTKCWSQQRDARPTIDALLKQLSRIKPFQ